MSPVRGGSLQSSRTGGERRLKSFKNQRRRESVKKLLDWVSEGVNSFATGKGRERWEKFMTREVLVFGRVFFVGVVSTTLHAISPYSLISRHQ